MPCLTASSSAVPVTRRARRASSPHTRWPLTGAPWRWVKAGTRIGVDFVLDLMASGWTEARILAEYPHLKPDDLQAVFAFVRDCMRDEDFVLKAKAAEAAAE